MRRDDLYVSAHFASNKRPIAHVGYCHTKNRVKNALFINTNISCMYENNLDTPTDCDPNSAYYQIRAFHTLWRRSSTFEFSTSLRIKNNFFPPAPHCSPPKNPTTEQSTPETKILFNGNLSIVPKMYNISSCCVNICFLFFYIHSIE